MFETGVQKSVLPFYGIANKLLDESFALDRRPGNPRVSLENRRRSGVRPAD